MATKLQPVQVNMVELLKLVYPVGSVYINYSDSTNPGTLLGFGTWVATAVGRSIVGLDSGQTEFDTAGETGGAKTVTLTAAQSGLPAHSHIQNVCNGAEGSGSYYGRSALTNSSYGGSNIPIINNPAANASSAHNNLQPYQVFYIWRRSA